MFGEAFIDRWLRQDERAGTLARPLPFLRTSIGYTLKNVGRAYTPHDKGDDFPLPRTANLTFGLSAGLSAAHPAAADWQLLRSTWRSRARMSWSLMTITVTGNIKTCSARFTPAYCCSAVNRDPCHRG